MFQLHAVTNNQLSESIEALSERIIALLPFVDRIQIREKSRTPKAIEHLIRLITERVTEDQLILNDRADIALALGLTQIHLTESSLPISLLHNTFPALSFGRSFHSAVDVMNELRHYDYGYIGHIFPTALKTYPPFGIDNLKIIAETRTEGTLLAIGGIDETNITTIAPYVDGIAVMSGFFTKSIEESIAHACHLRSLANLALTGKERNGNYCEW